MSDRGKQGDRKQHQPFALRAAVRPKTLNAEERTVELCWTTGAEVLRYDWWEGQAYYERLKVDDEAIDLTRLNSGAPLLDSHVSWGGIGQIIGVVESAWIEDGEGRALVRFSDRADVEPFFRDVVNGIIRNVSVGYDPIRVSELDEMIDGIPVRETTRWMPLEISLVPIPADAAAQVRAQAQDSPARRAEANKGHDMANAKQKTKRRSEEEEEREDVVEDEERAEDEEEEERESSDDSEERARHARAEGVRVERTRQKAIREAARKAGLEGTVADELIDKGLTVAQARAAIIDAIAEHRATPEPRTTVQPGDNAHHAAFREHASAGLLHRSGIERTTDPNALAFSHHTLVRLAEDCLRREGVNTTGMPPHKIAKRAMLSTGDFGDIIAKHAARSLRKGYESYPRTFQEVFRRATDVMNFKDIERVMMSDAPELLAVAEGGRYEEGGFSDSKQTYRVTKWGRIIPVTWELVINDDLDGIGRIPHKMGSAASRRESDVAWGVINGNGDLGDSSPIFHTDHDNLVSTELSPAALEAGRQYFREILGSTGEPLNLQPVSLVVSSALESYAEKLLTENTLVGRGRGDILVSSLRNLRLVVEPRLSGWLLAASPDDVDTVEYAYLSGEEGVTMEEHRTHDVDDLLLKIRLVFGAGCIDRIGMYRSSANTVPDESGD